MRFPSLFRNFLLACALFLPGLAIAENQPKAKPSPYTKQTHIDNKRAQKEGSLKQQLGIREQALKYGRSTARADEQIARLREDLAILNSGEDPETINLKLQILDSERNKKIYQKMGQDTSHIDRQIEIYKRRLRGEPLSAGTPPSTPKSPTSKPAKPSHKPKPPMSEKMRQSKIKSLKNSIRGMENHTKALQARGKQVPQGHLDLLARKKAELAELEK